ncbi:MAG: hypothetical protein NTX72_05055 [Candidatus Uhrbacteria bacterium]|nr:hypothetical protein [Candidatus Uhrbacteria bacterium]
MKRMVTTNGRAAIFEDEDPIFTLEVINDPSGKKVVEVKPYAQGLHLGMWLQAAGSCSESTCTEKNPFPSLQAHLIHWAWVQELISFFITCIDASFSIELRNLAATEFETIFSTTTDDVRKEIERIIMETPPPEGMLTRGVTFTGLSAAIMEKFVAKFGHQPPEQTL